MRRLARDAASIATGLLTSVVMAILVGRVGLFAMALGTDIVPTVAIARVANVLLVPLAGGLVVGAFRPRRPVVLAVLLVVLSLLGTYRSLGPAGMPHGWKIVAYLVQTVIVAIAAIWSSRGRSSTDERSGRRRKAGDLTNAEADNRSEGARFARHDPIRLQLS